MFSIMSTPAARGALIEIVTFKPNAGVTADEFRPLARRSSCNTPETTGFISRKSAAGDNGEWLVVVHWRSVADAEASMASFPSTPARAQSIAKIDDSTMSMKRYTIK
jgi:hypothetical protein